MVEFFPPLIKGEIAARIDPSLEKGGEGGFHQALSHVEV